MNDLRKWMMLVEVARKPRISSRDVTMRLRQLNYEDRITQDDVRSAYENIMRSADFENNHMIIYRGMTIEEPEWFTELTENENLGRYWAYEREGATIGSWDKPNVIFTALVDLNKINWGMTVAQEIAIGGEHESRLVAFR